jgi:hypothetical protein
MLNQERLSMRSQIGRIRRPLTDDEFYSVAQKESGGERLNEMLAKASMKNVPLEDRRREAKKPLCLIRYE